MELAGLLCVVCEPDSGKMAPAELADDEISAVGKGVADLDGMVPAFDIVLPVFLVLCHDGSRVRRIGTVGHPSPRLCQQRRDKHCKSWAPDKDPPAQIRSRGSLPGSPSKPEA